MMPHEKRRGRIFRGTFEACPVFALALFQAAKAGPQGPAIRSSGIALDQARDGGLERRRYALEVLDIDLNAIFDTRDFRARQATRDRQIFEAIASRLANLLNAISDAQDVDNFIFGLIEMIERYVHTWSLRIMPWRSRRAPILIVPSLDRQLICCTCEENKRGVVVFC
jgi:hypothetical protein